MNTLTDAINHYLALRRGLGFKLIQVEYLLHHFATFMKQHDAAYITIELALQWAVEPQQTNPAYWAKRLRAVRGFARHHSATDPRTEIPAPGLLPYRPARAKPYLYSEDDIQHLMKAARALPPRNGLRGWTYSCLLGLLAVTGLRISEALALKRDDVDLNEGLLTIRQAKFAKSRLVPLHASTQAVLRTYGQRRDAYPACRHSIYFLISEKGTSLSASTVRGVFCKLSRQIGLRGPDDRHGPRLHDLRHRFAVEVLLRGYQSDEAIERRLSALSTFLGHTRVSDTYWYLSACPELMGQAVRRLEKCWEIGS